MPRPPRPAPEPLDTNDVLIAGVGTVAWTLALVVLLLIELPAGDRWWLWVCVAGIASGLFGMWYIPRLQRRRAERAQSSRDAEGDESASLESPRNGAAQRGTARGDRRADDPRASDRRRDRTRPK